jgi:hypothetical protein
MQNTADPGSKCNTRATRDPLLHPPPGYPKWADPGIPEQKGDGTALTPGQFPN